MRTPSHRQVTTHPLLTHKSKIRICPPHQQTSKRLDNELYYSGHPIQCGLYTLYSQVWLLWLICDMRLKVFSHKT